MNPDMMKSQVTTLICEAADKLSSHSDAAVQSWAMLLLAEMTRWISKCPEGKSPLSDGHIVWESVWERALKRFYLQGISRAACFLSLALCSSQLLDRNRARADLIRVGLEIEIQGPPLPSDAACSLLEEILRVAESDLRTYKSDIPGKVCSRIIGHWQVPARAVRPTRAFSQKPQADPFIARALLHLLNKVSYGTAVSIDMPPQQIVLPDGALTAFWTSRQTSKATRDWFWHATLSMEDTTQRPLSHAPFENPGGQPRTNNIVVRLIVWLRKTMETLLGDLEEADEVHWAGMTLERMRGILEVIWLSLAFEAHADLLHVVRSERLGSQATMLLNIVLPRIQQSKWTVSEKASLLQSLSPLLLGSAAHQDQQNYNVIIRAGQSSGIRRSALSALSGELQCMLRA